MSNNANSNNDFYQDLDTNFKLACKMSEYEFSHNELLDLLKNGNIPQKQIAALKFDYIKTKDDAYALLNNLTGCDGKIREAVAMKINLLLNQNPELIKLFSEISAETFANAAIDINGNICRLIIDSSALLKDYRNFSTEFTKRIVKFTLEALEELDKFAFRDKKYVINKQLFKLYWCLEALRVFYKYADDTTLREIIDKCAKQSEYTIREKTAQIITASGKFDDIAKKLLNDENYYVRQVLQHPSVL